MKSYSGLRLLRIISGMLLAALLVGCLNPFGEYGGGGAAGKASSSQPRLGSIKVGVDGTLGASTIAPDLTNLTGQIVRYDLGIDDGGPLDDITQTNYTPGTPVNDIPYGTWTVTLTGYSDAGGTTQIASGTATLTVDAATNSVDVTMQPAATLPGTGSLSYSLSFPTGMVDGVAVTLTPWAGGPDTTFTPGGDPGYNTDFATSGTLTLTANSLQSQFYVLEIQLSDSTQPGGSGNHAPVRQIVHIYDNLESVGSDTLTAAELRSPPAAPSNLVIEYSDPNAVVVRWADNSNTEAGFRVYASATFPTLARAQVGPDIAAGLTASATLDPGLTGPSDDLVIEVVAFNAFGESVSTSVEFRALGNNDLPTFNPNGSDRTNDASWVAAADPGDLGGSTLIVGGADSVDLWIGTADVYGDVTSLPAATVTGAGPIYDLAGLPGGLTPGATHYFRVRAVTTGGEIFYPGGSFTVRDGNLYVDGTNGNAAAAGSATDPVDTIGEAIGLAEDGEEIRIAAGTYTENLPLLGQDVTLSGSYDPGFGARNPTANTILDSTQQYTLEMNANVTIDRMEIRAGQSNVAYGIIEYFGGDLLLRDSVLFLEADTVQTGNSLIGLFLFDSNTGADTVSVDNTRFSVDETATNATSLINALRISSNFDGTVRLENGTEFQQVGTEAAPVFTNLNLFTWINLFSGGAATASLELDNVTVGEAWLDDDVNASAIAQNRELLDFSMSNSTVGQIGINGTTDLHALDFRFGAQSFVISDSVIETADDQGNSYAVRLAGPFATQPIIERTRMTLGVPITSGSSFGVYAEAPTGAAGSFRLVNNVITNRGLGSQFWYGVFAIDWIPEMFHNTLVAEHTGAARHLAVRADSGDMNGIELGNNLMIGTGALTHRAVEEIASGNSYSYNEFSGNGLFGTIDATQTAIENYNALGTVGANFVAVADPSLDANGRPQPGTTPYRVRSGGVDFTGAVPTDFDGTTRTVGTGVTVGAVELDDVRTLRTVIFNGTIDGVGAGIFQAQIVDDGSTIAMNPTLVRTLADPLNDARALDYTIGATDEIHYVDGTDIWVIDLAAGPPFTPTLRGDLTATWPNGLTLTTPNVQDIHLFFDAGNLLYEYFVADLNFGIYYVDVSTNTVVDLMSYAGIDGTAVISDTIPTNMWFANSSNGSLSRASATVNTQFGFEDQIEVATGEVINDIGFDSVDTFWLAVETTNQADGYIAVDRDASGPGDRQVIIDQGDINGEPSSIFYDVGLDLVFWTEIGTFYDTNIRMAFGDGHVIGAGFPTLISGGNGAGQLTDGSNLAVKQ